nr:hypothetical protein [Tanacetum cinerariifolium]
MDTIIDQQVAMDEALVPRAKRLRIRRSNFRLLLDIKSKESTLQLVYDFLRICLFFKAFLVTADVPEIYMQEFCATTTVHYHSIRFKMDNKKHIMNLESFRDMLHICLRVHGQSFNEPPFKEEILAFIHFLGHSAGIRTLTDVNINKLYQPWRSFTAIINKCLTEKSSCYDNLRLSQAQILWGLPPEEFATGEAAPKPKASVRRTRTSSDTSIIPPIAAAGLRLTTSQKGVLDVPTDESEEELLWNSTDDEGADDEGKDGDDAEEDEGDDGEKGDGDDDDDEDDDGEEGDDDDDQEVVSDDDKDDAEKSGDDEEEGGNSEDERNGEEDLGLNVSREGRIKEEEEDKLYRHVNINQERGLQTTLEVEDSHVTLTPVNPDGIESIFGSTSQLDVETPTSMNEAVKVAFQVQSDRLRDETQRENDEFLRTVDENMKKIIKEQVKEQVKDEEPSAGPNRGSMRRKEGKEPESRSALTETTTRSAGMSTQGSRSRQASVSESALAEEPMQTTSQMEEPSHLEFDTGADDQPIVQSSQHPEWFSPQQKPPTLDRDWNKTLPAVHRSIQPWISELAKQADSRSFFNKLMDTPLVFSNFLMIRLRVDTLTPEFLIGPTYELMKGSCKSLVELEYHLEDITPRVFRSLTTSIKSQCTFCILRVYVKS